MPKNTKIKTKTLAKAPIKAPLPNPLGAKRDPSVIQNFMDTFLGFVRKNPGLRIEQINAQLGTCTKDLALPIRKLIAAKMIRTKGEKRATTYEAKR